MKCPECVKEGKKSKVYDSMMFNSTCLHCPPFYDEDGEYHNHDLNIHSKGYSCSNGHQWSVALENKCPNPKCDWG